MTQQHRGRHAETPGEPIVERVDVGFTEAQLAALQWYCDTHGIGIRTFVRRVTLAAIGTTDPRADRKERGIYGKTWKTASTPDRERLSTG